MKKNIAVFPALFLGLATLASSQAPATAPITAPAAVPTKIGIIKLEEALAVTKEGLKAQADMAAKYQPRQDALAKKQADIQAKQAQLTKGKATMSPEAQQKLQADIDAAIKSFNRENEDMQAEVQEDQGKVLNELGGKMMEILKAYATLNNFAVILDVGNDQTPVLVAAPSLDLTPDMVKLYDEKYPVAAAAGAAAKPGVPAGANTVKAPAAPAPPPVKKP